MPIFALFLTLLQKIFYTDGLKKRNTNFPLDFLKYSGM